MQSEIIWGVLLLLLHRNSNNILTTELPQQTLCYLFLFQIINKCKCHMIMHCEYQDTKRIVGQGQHPTGTDLSRRLT